MSIWPSLALKNLLEGQMTFAFLGLEIAGGDDTAEPFISGAIGRIGQHLEAIDGHQPCADEKLYFSFFGFVVSAHHAGKRVAVGNADSGKLKAIGSGHHLLRVRSPAQEGKISCHS